MKPILKPPGTEHLKLKCDVLLSTFAFKFNLRRYTVERGEDRARARGRSVQVDPLKPTLKAPGTKRMEL
jgi:hypothetical protein